MKTKFLHLGTYFIICISTTLFSFGSLASIEIGNSNKFSNDSYSGYQWYLNISDQIIYRDSSNIKSHRLANNSNAGLQFESLEKLNSNVKKEVIVAVLDTGIDFSHPDLQGIILKNDSECTRDGDIPLRSLNDKDSNGFPGDCMGWNFSAEGIGNNRPEDDTGHGTHIAGILAARRNNGIGISGISSHIKILPIKIYGEGEFKKNNQKVSLSQRLIKGLQYAKQRNADIILLSMGWPISVDSDQLRSSFREMKDAGIIVVAAAGNDSTDAPVVPCSYPDVICVGASTIERKIAPFSNFGSHVDVLAPGEEILSTFPIAIPSSPLPPSLHFPDPKYEVLSGTSTSEVLDCKTTLSISLNEGATRSGSVVASAFLAFTNPN